MPIVRRKKTGGRKCNPVLRAFTNKYQLTKKQVEYLSKILVQFALCESEEARRLLLGVSDNEE
jgi:hypothetical protein